MIASSAAAQAPGRRGDGGPATQAPLRFPASVAALPDGGFVIADSGDRSIRRVTAGGVISTVARGLGPVGVPLVLPTGVAPLGNGDLVVADPGAQAVWRIAPDGSGVRFAGTGTPGFSGDGGRVTDAALDDPVAVSVTPAGPS